MRIDSPGSSPYVNHLQGDNLKVDDRRQAKRGAEVPPPLNLPQVPTGSKLQLPPPASGLQSGDYSGAISKLDGSSGFNVMAYYSLLLEFAKNEKTAAREDREALRLESESLLQKAADKMRLAAGLALAGGLASGVASIAGGAIETAGSIKAGKLALSEGETGGAGKLGSANKAAEDIEEESFGAEKPTDYVEPGKGENDIEMQEFKSSRGEPEEGVETSNVEGSGADEGAEEEVTADRKADVKKQIQKSDEEVEDSRADAANEGTRAAETKAKAQEDAEEAEASKSKSAQEGEDSETAIADKQRFEKLLAAMDKQRGMVEPDRLMRKFSGLGAIVRGTGDTVKGSFDFGDRMTEADEKDLETQSQKVRDYADNEGEFRGDFASLEKDVIEKASQFLQSRESTMKTIVNA